MAMERLDRKAMLGHKIRRFRQDQGLSQTEMAEQIGISPSYLNLIEHNQRPVTVPMLFKLGATYEIDLKEFAEDDDQRLAAGLSEVFGDPLFQDQRVADREIKELVSAAPAAAQGILSLYQAYRRLWVNAEALAHETGREHSESAIAGPENAIEQVREFLEQASNHFPELEKIADTLWEEAELDRDSLFATLAEHIRGTYELDVKVMPQTVLGDTLRRFDHHRRRILISEVLLPTARTFNLAVQLALIGYRDTIDRIANEADGLTDDGRGLVKLALAGYLAGAIMMPYQTFLNSAKELSYDIELLRRRFGASVEQVCHRLTTLQRPGARGVAFFFLRVDHAGNVSKRLSGSGFRFARFGGTCPRLVVHDAFRTPGHIQTQVARLPDDNAYFIIARTLDSFGGGAGVTPQYAIALGCDLKDAKNLAYAKEVGGKTGLRETPAGVSCRVCERIDCNQRAHPPVNHKIRVDLMGRRERPFDFVL